MALEHAAASFGAKALPLCTSGRINSWEPPRRSDGAGRALTPPASPETVIVCYGDTPLVTGEILARYR